jgi:Protein of unknown function (DUF1566)
MKIIKNFALALCLAMSAINTAQAVPTGIMVGASGVVLQGGSTSSANYQVPTASSSKVYVQVPSNGTATNALYRVYPKGNVASNTTCSSTDALYPCFEIPVNQALNQNKWVQLTLNSKATTKWAFTVKGFVTINASNLATTEQLNLGMVVFQGNLFKIGQTYKGGIIFYLDSTKQHGLIAAPIDQSMGIQWDNGSSTTANATGTSIGTGKTNTTAIITTQGAGDYAAKLCDDLVVGRYKDWYLPSKEELNLMYKNIGQGAAAPLTNIGGFASAYYWASSEYDSYNIWHQDFSNGYQQLSSKGNIRYVRAIRSF